MVDNQENKLFEAGNPAEEAPAEPKQEPVTEPEETALSETVTPEKLPEAAVADGFSEVTEPVTEPAEPPAEQVPLAEPELPTVEEPAIPVNAETEQTGFPQQTQEVMRQTQGVVKQTWEAAQQTPEQPSVPPVGYAYPQGYQVQQAEDAVKQTWEAAQQTRDAVKQTEEAAQQTPAQPVYGYSQPQPPYQPHNQPQYQEHSQQPSAPYGYPQPPQPPYQPQNQPPYQGYPQQAYVPQNQPPYPSQNGYYGQPGYPIYAAPVNPPKKKMSTGLKVFIWIASILAAAAIIGFGSYLVYNAFAYSSGAGRDVIDDRMPFDRLPGGRGDREDWDEDEIPDFDDGVIPPEEDKSVPDVDVTPNTEGITIHPEPKGEELSAQEVYQKVVKSTVTVAVTYNGSNSTGTGIIATSDGYIITNSHVVMNSKSSVVEITTNDGQTYEAVVVGVDRTTDLAILKTNDYNFTPAEFGDSDGLAIGDQVVAIGNPGGAKFSGSMTGGYISGLDRAVGSYSENGMTYIQTDAAINPGNSGGPLVNMYGQVVGINSSKIVSDGYEGMGFAIPVTKAQSIINELLSGGYVKGRTRLGITGMDVTSSMAMLYNMPRGFVITEINEDSAFTGTEAEVGDIIIALDGETVTGLTDISNLLLKHAPGDQATVTLYRQNGTELDVTITLLEDKGETQK